MLFNTISFFVASFFPLVILATALILSSRSTQDREKLSPFECGFDPKASARIPFSLRFFLLAVIFLVFDIEIALLIPIPMCMKLHITSFLLIGGSLFLVVLILGLVHEWNEGSLDWSS
uniref:NADH-ubiquinone oxidoreductase chain 3 n=1 Tax=Glycera cf. tridactyla FS19 TaxID=1763829 RepID=A0A0S3CR07_9ANNE|nr:NADH dehydrogenase subunit 3 [Glycera cf. tridactyla FS19]